MSEKKERYRFIYLFLIMIVTSSCVGGAILILLYNTSFELHRERLVEMVKSQARLIEAVARFDNKAEATLSQLVDAHQHYKGFGETGEFTLAKLKGKNIVFLLSHRHDDVDDPNSVPLDSDLAEPMRRALSKQIGTVVAKDYRGQTVLAAYETVEELQYGIVAKIDLSEIRKPFIKTGKLAAGIIIILVGIGALFFLGISDSILKDLIQKNVQLRQEITERTEAQEQLANSLEEKNVLLKEVHHRVKNNMAMVCSLLQLQALEIENENDRKRFIEAQNRIYTMALVHERLYDTEDFTRIDFNKFIHDISETTKISYASSCEVVVVVDAEDGMLDLNKAVPCGLIINELISNSFKHAFPGKKHGTIDICFHRTVGGHFKLIISDDGVGFPDNFDISRTPSMGMQLISRLTGQLDGSVNIGRNNTLKQGAAIEIIFS